MAYLESKGEGDKSMPLKRGACRGVLGAASRDPCDKAKAGLLEAQSPVMKVRIHRKKTPETDATPCPSTNRTLGQPPRSGASSNMPNPGLCRVRGVRAGVAPAQRGRARRAPRHNPAGRLRLPLPERGASVGGGDHAQAIACGGGWAAGGVCHRVPTGVGWPGLLAKSGDWAAAVDGASEPVAGQAWSRGRGTV